jgi:sugar phosphate isomerase/epimerase
MYFSMDEIGFENEIEIKKISSESNRWKFIYDTAKTYGFEGIHITPSFYDKLGLGLNNIPDYFQDFKLTLHLGGMYLIPESKYKEFDIKMETSFKIALKNKMHDISIHPPYIHELTEREEGQSLDSFHKIINKWLKISEESGLSLSLETHVDGNLFNGLNEYISFIDNYPNLGILIDISHNYYKPQHSEEEIIYILGGKNVKGLHISDALRDAGYEKGTHLAVGDGTINFTKLLRYFQENPNLYGVLEIKSSKEGIIKSLAKLKNI